MTILRILFLVALAQLVPLAFIAVDLRELGLAWNVRNSVDVYNSQSIYAFSSLIFPSLFVLLYALLNKIRNQEKFYRETLATMNDQVVVVDVSGKMVFANKNAGDEGRIELFRQLAALELTNDSDILKIDGSTFAVSFSSFDRYRVINLKDITPIIEREKLISDQQAQLTRNEHLASLGTMASGIAHEINNPLAVILGNLEVLKQLIPKDPQTDRLTQRIEAMVIRISEIVKTMKKLSRTDLSVEASQFSLREVFHDLNEIFGIKIKGTGIDFRMSGEFREIMALANQSQLTQVLINLLNNAYDEVVTHPDPWIELEARSTRDLLEIRVRNSGPRISDDLLDKIFTPFFTTKAPGEGTGLGLSISYNIMKKFDGDLYVDGQERHTTFVVRLPQARRLAA